MPQIAVLVETPVDGADRKEKEDEDAHPNEPSSTTIVDTSMTQLEPTSLVNLNQGAVASPSLEPTPLKESPVDATSGPIGTNKNEAQADSHTVTHRQAISNALSRTVLPNSSVVPLSVDGIEMPYSESARRVCLRLSLAQMLVGTVITLCSFAAWRYPVIVGIATIAFGLVGSQHYHSREAVQSSSFCCHPELFIAHQTNMQVSLATSALIACGVSIAAAVFAPPELLGFAIINAVACLAAALLSLSVAVYNGQFQREVDWFRRESL